MTKEQHDFGMALAQRMAEVVNEMVAVYKDNDPEASSSGSDYGLGRRHGRRDVAVQTIALLLGQTESNVKRMIVEGTL